MTASRIDVVPPGDNAATDVAAWYCLRTKPRQESAAAHLLSLLPELEVYCPRVRFQRETRRGLVWFVEALFPGYFFASFERTRLREIRHSPKVSTIVHFGDYIPALDPDLVRQLRAAFPDDLPSTLETSMAVGDAIRIVEGPLAGQDAVVAELLPGRERVRVLLEFLGGEQRVELNLQSIFKRASRIPLKQGRE